MEWDRASVASMLAVLAFDSCLLSNTGLQCRALCLLAFLLAFSTALTLVSILCSNIICTAGETIMQVRTLRLRDMRAAKSPEQRVSFPCLPPKVHLSHLCVHHCGKSDSESPLAVAHTGYVTLVSHLPGPQFMVTGDEGNGTHSRKP